MTKKPKSKRVYLGRVDPVTKLIVEKAENGKRNRSKLGKNNPGTYVPEEVSRQLDQLRQQIREMNLELEKYKAKVADSDKLFNQIRNLIDSHKS